VSLRDHAGRRDAASGKLPVYHVYYGTEEHWFASRDILEAFMKGKEQAAGGELEVGRIEEAVAANDPTPGTAHDTGRDQLVVVELHEVRSINSGLKELEGMGFEIESLLPQDRTGREESRYTLRRGESEIGLVRETTLDPANRTLVRVTMTDAAAADDLFRVLMGEKVEPRREFIERHALDVKNLDV